MYIQKNLGNLVSPYHFIPKPHPNLNADQSSDLLRNFPAKYRPKKVPGKIYWGSYGPVVSRRPVINGDPLSNVSSIYGLGDFTLSNTVKWATILGVLSLIIVYVCHYNKWL